MSESFRQARAMHRFVEFCTFYISLLPLVCARGPLTVSVEVWLVLGIVTVGTVGAVFISWFIFTWRVCHVYCHYRKANREFTNGLNKRLAREERYRSRQLHVSNAELEAIALRNTGSPFSSPSQVRRTEPRQEPVQSTTIPIEYQYRPSQIPRSTSNGSSIAMARSSTNSNLAVVRTNSNSSSQQEIARSNTNLHGIPRSSSNSSGFGATNQATSSGTGVHKPSNSVQSPCTPADQSQQATRLRIVTGPSSQLQSLSEIEEMDVRPEAGHGLPRYSYLFLETHETQGGQRLEGDKTTSPFSFSSERGGANRHAGRVQELNQLSSWPNFKL